MPCHQGKAFLVLFKHCLYRPLHALIGGVKAVMFCSNKVTRLSKTFSLQEVLVYCPFADSNGSDSSEVKRLINETLLFGVRPSPFLRVAELA
jgi:hypothetical protein